MSRPSIACHVLLSILMWESAASACDAARPSDAIESLPATWRDAVDTLIEATKDKEQPWGCSGGTIDLIVTDTGATIRVERGGVLPMERQVDSPHDLVPVGKAMLAEPGPIAPPIVAEQTSPATTATLFGPSAARDPPEVGDDAQAKGGDGRARARIEATGAARYAGMSHLMMVGAGLRGAIPIDSWYGTLALRYTTMIAELRSDVPDLGVWEVGMVGGFGYSLIRDPVRLDLGLIGGVAIVDMSATGTDSDGGDDGDDPSDEQGEQHGEDQVEGSDVDGRMGLELRLSIPMVDVLRAMIAVDAEMGFASLAERRIDPALPPLPAYSIGLNLGLEIGVP